MSSSKKFNQATGNNISIFPVHIFRGLGFKELDAPNLNINPFFDCRKLAFIILISVFVLYVQLLVLLHASQSTYLQKDTDYE